MEVDEQQEKESLHQGVGRKSQEVCFCSCREGISIEDSGVLMKPNEIRFVGSEGLPSPRDMLSAGEGAGVVGPHLF